MDAEHDFKVTSNKKPFFIGIAVIALAIIAAIAWTMRTGKLSVKSTPAGCQLELNGKVVDGKTPMELPPLRCGEYQLKLSHPGYHDWTGTATVNWRSVTDVTGELKKILTTGFIKLDSSPEGARIILDGTDTKQKTPATLQKVKPGERHIRVILPGYEDTSATVTVEKEETANANLTLKKLPEKIAYIATIDYKAYLCLASPDGSQQQVWKKADYPIAISPDGSRIAEITPYGIQISHIDGRKIRLIKQTAYSSFLPKDMVSSGVLHWIDNQRLLLKGLAYTGENAIGDYGIGVSSKGKVIPSISGKNISDISSKNKLAAAIGGDIFVSDLDGSNRINATKAVQGGGYNPRWSPDGQLLAFQSTGLWVVSADGSNPKHYDNYLSNPVWSPDSREIAAKGSREQIIDVNSQTRRNFIDGDATVIWWGTLKGVGSEPGKIKLTSNPSGARITLNQQPTGEATPVILDALPGPNEVQIWYDNKWTDNIVWVKSGATSTLNAKF